MNLHDYNILTIQGIIGKKLYKFSCSHGIIIAKKVELVRNLNDVYNSIRIRKL